MKKLFIVISLILLATNTFAGNCSTSERKLAIYFSNGMSNDKGDAKKSLNALILKTKPILQSQGYTLNYGIAYNKNENWYYQILEVFRQKQIEEWSLLYSWLSGLDIAPDWFRNALKTMTQAANSINYIFDADLQKHIANYKAEIENCRRVLIVAHSQGNFYANSAWKNIYSNKIKSNKYDMKNFPGIGLLSVATPAAHVGNSLLSENDHQPITGYVTLSNDWIVNAVRTKFVVLPANYTNSHKDNDWKHHAFVDSYLNGDVTGPVMIQLIQNISGKLETLPFGRKAITSSFLKSVGYLPKSKILEVEFAKNRSLYRYYGVPRATYDALMTTIHAAVIFITTSVQASFTKKYIKAFNVQNIALFISI